MKSPDRQPIDSAQGGGSQFGQDDFLDRIVFRGARGGTFLDLGGFDGVTGSNSLLFERRRGWTGWLLEPDPDLCDQSRSNRACACLQLAIAETDGRASFWRPTSAGRRMMGGLRDTMRPTYLERLRSEPAHSEETIEVTTISPRSLLKEIGVDTIDYVSMDIEGAERAVLEAFPFDEVAVGAWSIENLEGADDIERLMDSKGYSLVRRLGVDEIYVPHDRAESIRERRQVGPFDEAADLLEAGFYAHALTANRALIEAAPHDPYAWNNLGLALAGIGDSGGALDAHRRAVELDPSLSIHRRNLQRALITLDRQLEALSVGEGTPDPSGPDRALAEQSRFELAYRHGKTSEAVAASHRWELALSNADARPRLARAEALLADGRLAEGWACFEARNEPQPDAPDAPDGIPAWQGEPMEGKRLLVLGEQGFGDQLFFSRFVPIASERGAQTTVAVAPPLRRLLEQTGDKILDPLEPNDKRMVFDAWVRVGSLPHLTGTATFVEPRALKPPDDAIERAKNTLGPRSNGVRRAGIVWSGRATTTHQRARHIPLDVLRPAFELPDVQWFSLSKGPMTTDIARCGLDERIIDVGTSDRDLADTAAVCAELDLVVTVCTVTAHLAASLGVPTIVLVHHRPFWVWGHTGSTTLWYPTARVLRQREPGNWAPVVDELIEVIAGD